MSRGFKLIFCIIFDFILISFSSKEQTKDSTFVPKNAFKSATLSIKDPVSNIKFGGYFRFLGFVRDLPTMYPLNIPSYYSGVFPQQTTISVGTGYREPMMLHENGEHEDDWFITQAQILHAGNLAVTPSIYF